jgi:lipopolysaccharide/colanic/teichoic acid biosynthesis glycosyltransferase
MPSGVTVATPSRAAGAPRADRCARAVHAALSALGLVLLSPVLVLVAVAIKLTSPGPVFYRGGRVGRGQRIFRIYKFRTLVEGAEGAIGGRLLERADRGVYFTRIGRFLKRTKLDELPQLLNVLKGDMRLVGPRPVRPVFLPELIRTIPGYASRFEVAPGITGIAQLRGGYYTPPRNKLRYDRVYIARRGLALDAQLVLLTFVKILNRWLSTGLFVAALIILVSLVPSDFRPTVGLDILGRRLDLVQVVLMVGATWFFVRKGPTEFSLYRCPLYLPVVLFVAVSLAAWVLSGGHGSPLRGTGYYVVAGALLAFLIVNTLAGPAFTRLVARAVALTSVAISVLALSQIFFANYAAAFVPAPPGAHVLTAYAGVSRVLGDAAALAVYLVLGIPLLLAEVRRAPTRAGRDFWVVCATLSVVGIVFTQSVVGLVALAVTASVFVWPPLRRAGLAVGVLLPLLVLLMAALASARAPDLLGRDVAGVTRGQATALAALPATTWLLGGATGGDDAVSALPGARGPRRSAPAPPAPSNSHLALILDTGLPRWLIIMWLVVSVLAALSRVHARTRDTERKALLGAIMAALAGFVVSMNGVNTFENAPIQVLFWSLVGVGLAVAVRANGRRRDNMIWRFGDAGD